MEKSAGYGAKLHYTSVTKTNTVFDFMELPVLFSTLVEHVHLIFVIQNRCKFLIKRCFFQNNQQL